MKKWFLILLLFGCSKQSVHTFNKSEASISPAHIIVVILENHGYDQIIDNDSAPYINSLADSGILFTNFHGVTHPSQPNYIALFSGSRQNVTDDKCLSKKLKAANLYSKLESVGKTCAWYSEDLPATGSIDCHYNDYVRKHNASSDFSNVPADCNKMFTEFSTDFNSLENLVFITPNLQHDMHDGTVKQCDDWLQTNCKTLADWCKLNNSLFIVTYDEDEGTTDNNIPVIFYGGKVSIDTNYYDHYNLTKTICSLMGAPIAWTDNLKSRKVIKF